MLSTFEHAWLLAKDHTVLGEGRSCIFWGFLGRVSNAQGDVASLGVWRGGSALLMGLAFPKRRVHLFDTFRGYPDNGRFGAGEPLVDTARLLMGQEILFTAHVGEFPSSAANFHAPLAAAHIDCDLAEPAAAALRLFWPLLSPGGVLIVDDYGQSDCQGLREAVDAWCRVEAGPHLFEENDGQVVISRP